MPGDHYVGNKANDILRMESHFKILEQVVVITNPRYLNQRGFSRYPTSENCMKRHFDVRKRKKEIPLIEKGDKR